MPKPGQPADDAVSSADDEIDALWNEADADDGLPRQQALADEAEPSGADAPAAEAAEDADGDPADVEVDEWEEEEKPAPSPASTDAPAAPAKAETAEPDIWSNASPELLAARDKLLEHNRRIQSNLSAQQRMNEAARRELAALKAQKERQAQQEEDPDLKSAEEEYPEVVKPMLRRMADLDDRLSKAELEERRRQDAAEIAAQERVEAETARVEATMPGYLALISVETDGENGETIRTAKPEFVAWYRSQPAEVRAKVDRNADDITNAEEAIEVLGAYKAFADRIEAARNPATAPTPAPSRRDRQLRSAGAVQTRSQIGLTPGIPKDGDPDLIWQAMDREDAQKEARRR